MQDIKPTQQETVIRYDTSRPVNIGDVFYVIEHGETKTFYEPCRVCGDTRKVTVNGVTFTCPCCTTESQTISITKCVVHRYRVCQIAEEMRSETWKTSDIRNVKFRMYRKVGRGAANSFNNFGGDLSVNSREFQYLYNRAKRGGIYDDYNLAVSAADIVNAAELKRLEDYNAEHKTSYVATFTAQNDPKSD